MPKSSKQLGLSKTEKSWALTLWSSSAEEMKVHLYRENKDLLPDKTLKLDGLDSGYWQIHLGEEWTQHYYTVQAKVNGQWMTETVDPYAKLVGMNGSKAYIALPSVADPERWEADTYIETSPDEAIIYELHIRDFSIDSDADFEFPGKYLAFTELGLTLKGEKIGIDHLKELGITHVHLLPAFDYRSIDESQLEANNYNWGYDPLNYNVPEGSYSTDPEDPLIRVREFKQMVMALHQAGIAVVMDVVYNHTGHTQTSNFNQLDPEYYYRMVGDDFSNASACGNETASEKPMMQKFIVESLTYWMQEYHVDGFRVDLMGIHDIETMNKVKKNLETINPNVLLYGEGWAAGSSPLSASDRALKENTSQLDDIAVFSDEFRDALKGHWNMHADRGFVTGKSGVKESLKFGLVGGVNHPEIAYPQVNYTDKPWAANALQMISYVTCHDGMTLIDKLKHSYPGLSEDQYQAMHKLANTFVMLSQGIPFLHGGVEFLRSKKYVDNSFESPDSINAIKWAQKSANREIVNYYQELIKLKKSHPALKLIIQSEIEQKVTFPETGDDLLLVYQIDARSTEDPWSHIMVIFNGDLEEKQYTPPTGNWYFRLNSGVFVDEKEAIDELAISPSTATILFQKR